MNEINEAVQTASEVSAIKALIEQRVHTIRGSIAGFLDLQRDKQVAYEQRITELTKYVSVMESESSRLRDSFTEQHAKAHSDPVTGVPNRLAYEERALLKFNRCSRNGGTLTLAILDLDNFKKVNDSYGHKAGDKLLKCVATLCHQRVRATDLFARYGGEEFVVLLPDTGMEAALAVCEELRLQNKGDRVPVTVSIGIAALTRLDTLSTLFERADQALYDAKQNGRNRVAKSA